MSKQQDNLTPDYGEYDLTAVMAEYRKAAAAKAAEAALEKAIRQEVRSTSPARSETVADREQRIADRSRRIVMDVMGETLQRRQQKAAAAEEETSATAEKSPQDPPVAVRVSPAPEKQTEEKTSPGQSDFAPDDRSASEQDRPEPVSQGQPEQSEDESPPVSAPEPSAEDGMAEEEDPLPDPISLFRKRRGPRTEEKAPDEEEPDLSEENYEEAERVPFTSRIASGLSSFADRFLTPAVRMLATRLAQRQMQKAEAANWPDPVDIRDTRELPPGKAAKYYHALLKPLRLRCRLAAVLCVILAWINLGLPMTGMLRVSLPLEAGVSVLLTLVVMLAALDVVTAGLQQLADLRPGAEALAVLAVILSCVDGLLVLFGVGEHLPFCAIGAVALCFALWGERLTCSALRRTFRTAAASKNPTVLTAEILSQQDEAGLIRSDRGSTEGIVRRSESQDMCQTAYAVAAPFLLGAALLLSFAASINDQWQYFLHTFSALLSVSASFAGFISFPLPFSLASRHLRNGGAALAGFEGCADIGRTRRIVITDEDLFPPGTMRFSEINVQEGVFLGKVVSSTASLLCASGSGVSALFRELVDRRGYHIPNVDQFLIHEGGGLSGIVGGEKVLVGSAGFMNLMGIRLPQNLQSRNAICTALSGELVGVFVIEYIPTTSVQEALVTLLRGRTQTIFAIRDFNITPLMIRQLFLMPTENFNFPSFRDRYRLGANIASDSSPVNAVITRSGMLPMVEAAEIGRKLYSTCRISTILSLIGTGIGMVIMFLLCRAGSFDTASVGNVLSFMLLWALPVLILSVGQNRR